MSTFGDILSAVQTNVARTDAATNAMILASYNAVIEQMNSSQDWEELEAVESFPVAAGTAEYDLAAVLSVAERVKRPLSMWLVDGAYIYSPMKQYTETSWETSRQPGSNLSQAQPTAYVVRRKVVTLDPIPNKAFVCHVRFKFKARKAVDATSVIDFEDKDSMIAAATTAFTWAMLEEDKNAGAWFAIAKTLGMAHVGDNQRIPNIRAASSAQTPPSSGQQWVDPFSKK